MARLFCMLTVFQSLIKQVDSCTLWLDELCGNFRRWHKQRKLNSACDLCIQCSAWKGNLNNIRDCSGGRAEIMLNEKVMIMLWMFLQIFFYFAQHSRAFVLERKHWLIMYIQLSLMDCRCMKSTVNEIKVASLCVLIGYHHQITINMLWKMSKLYVTFLFLIFD